MRTKMCERASCDGSFDLVALAFSAAFSLLATGFLREQPNVQLEGAVKERWRAGGRRPSSSV